MSFLDKILNNNKKEDSQEGFFFNKKKKKSTNIQELIEKDSLEDIKKELTFESANEKDENSFYPLYYAVLYKREDVVVYLFSLGVKPESVKEKPIDNPIKMLIKANDINILKSFFEQKIILPRLIMGKPLIHYALEEKVDLDFIKLLMQNGAELEEYNKQTALQKAFEENSNLNIILYLVEIDSSSINIFNKDKNLLEDIILSSLDNIKKINIIKELKKQKNINLDVKTKNEEETILELAVRLKQNIVVKELILLGADFSLIKNRLNTLFEKGDLEEIINSINPQNTELVDFCSFLTYNKIYEYFNNTYTLENTLAILQVIDNPKLTLGEKIELVKFAVKKGAKVNEIDKKNNSTALLNYAKQVTINTSTSLLELLLSFGAKIEICGQSALFYMVKSYNFEILDLLLEHKANVNFNENEKTIINYILGEDDKSKDNWEIIKILKKCMEYNLDFNTKAIINFEENGEDIEYCENIFSLLLIKNRATIIAFLLEEKIQLDSSSDYIYYTIKYLEDLELQKKLIALNPNYEYEGLYTNKDEKESAQALGLAIKFLNEPLIEYLLDTYPKMKSYSTIEEIRLDLVEKNFKIETIKKLILKDDDINRKYIIYEENYKFSTTILFECAKRIVDKKYNKKDKYFELLEFLLQNGADANIQKEYLDIEVDSFSIFTFLSKDKLNEKLFDLLIKYGANPKEKTKLLNASSINKIVQNSLAHTDEDLIEYLEYFYQKVGIDIEDKDKNGITLLFAACASCKPKTVQWLIDKGANIHERAGADNVTALVKTIITYEDLKAVDRAKTVEVLIKAGANIEEFSNDMTPLMVASYYGAYLCVKVLLENGAKVNNKNIHNSTAINSAVLGRFGYDYPHSYEHVKSRIIKLLKEYNCDLNNMMDNLTSSLIITIKENKKDLFDTLLREGIDINLKNKSLQTALMYAISQGSIYFVNKLLKEPKINIHGTDDTNANVLYYTLYRYNKNEAISIFEELVQKGIEESLMTDGITLLHKACEIGNHEIIPSILKFTKYDINKQNEYGETALLNSVLNNYNIYEFEKIKVIRSLVSNGANLNIKDKNGNHILLYAIKLNEKSLIESLLELGANVNVTSNEGLGIFHILFDQNYSNKELELYIELFCKYGADINYNKNIDSPLLYFVKNMEFVSNRSMGFLTSGNKVKKDEDEIVDMLLKNGANLQLALEEAETKDIIEYLKGKIGE